MHNVLDDVVDKEAGAKPKLVGPPAPALGSVGSAIRHISQDELDAYVEGRLAGARLDFVRGHLDACEACRAELTDLRTYKANAVGLSQASSLKRELERRRRQRMLKTGATAAVAAAAVALIGVVAWNKYGKAWVHTASVAASAARASAVAAASADAQPRAAATFPPAQSHATSGTGVPGATAQPRATAVAPVASGQLVASTAGAASQQQAQVRGATPGTATASAAAGAASQQQAQVRGVMPGAATASAGAASQQQAQMRGVMPAAAVASTAVGAAQPRVAVAAVANVPQPRGATPVAAPAAGSTSFALLGPFGDELTDDRPEFAWQPLEGASKYSIIVVDEGLRPIAHTRLKTTTWRPKKPLRRGRTYLWQVTAILKNGTKVMGTGPTSQEARIHIGAPAK